MSFLPRLKSKDITSILGLNSDGEHVSSDFCSR